ncbi:unnamed protein product [Paramecium sonneborni]|uniref:Uncharacterized protein n=1 Tax=Paramecium sonneborni TaxID=65129 RepID=A0A8S1RKT4_9CILI|nr:unnamed protein product [Paramecium sonneborni]
MGVCTSQSQPKKVQKHKNQSLTMPSQQPLTTREQKTVTVQFQEPTSIKRITTPVRRVSPNQVTTPVQKASPNNTTTPVQRVSPSLQSTPKTMIVQSTQQQEKARNGSLLNIPMQRINSRQGSKSIQSPASRKYSVVSGLNHNSQSKTIMQHNETGQLVLVEILKYENRNQQYIDMLDELQLDHMHIVKIIDIHIDSQKKNYQVIYEHCQGGTLSKFQDSQELDYQTIGSIFYQMVEALAYVHKLGYSHDELTIDSFSVFDDSSTPFIKLSDIRSIYQFMYPKNSLLYEPPNSSNHHHHHKDSDKFQNIQTKNRSQSNDIWAIAIIILQLLNHEFPFEIENINKFKPEKEFAKQTLDIYPLLIEMLHHNPNDRITLEKCLVHPYLIKMKQIQPKDYLQPFNNIIKSKNMTYLHKCLFQYLLSFYASDHLKVLTKLFTAADLDKDGQLNNQELQLLFKEQPQEQALQISDFVDITLEDFLLFAADKQLVLTPDCLSSSFKAFSKSYNYITPKSISKMIPDSDEEKLQQDFDAYNLNYTFQQNEYEEFLTNYQSPKPII